jgi:hypothetical protein
VPAFRASTLPAIALLASACTEPAAAPVTSQAAPVFRCLTPPRLDPVLPAEILPILDQENVDCFAWQELIALGWPASDQAGTPNVSASPARFGDPAQVSPFVFQTYADIEDLFLSGAREPAPWGARSHVPAACAGDAEVARAVAAGAPILSSITEAGVAAPAWLTAQSGKPVYFEIRVNRDVFEYVRREHLYDARTQLTAAQKADAGIALPAGGSTYGHEGAVELKMAWLEIDPALASRYATTTAVLREPSGAGCRVARMGLVGMHISHKTPSAQQWTWSTFEHEDNAPDRLEVEQGAATRAYTFYRPGCTPPGAPECQPNRKPECDRGACDPMSRPVQVVREVSLAPEVRRLNEAMKQLISIANPRSVWQHYLLVDVMWPGSSEVVPPGHEVPLTHGGAQPTVLANVTMETYVQSGEAKKNCLDCHATAAVAPSVAEIAPTAATDYSFIFQRACDPAAPAGSCHPGSKVGPAR